MTQHTKICKMDGTDNPVHLCDLDALIPNVFVGMYMQVNGDKYKVVDVWSVVDKDFCRQIIHVEKIAGQPTEEEIEELLKEMREASNNR